MKTRILFVLAAMGVIAALISVYVYHRPVHPQAPVFDPSANPFEKGVYANGIVESDQPNGANMNIYPEVAGTVHEVLVHEGESVKKGAALFRIESSLQANTVMVAEAQVAVARANLKTATDAHAKLRAAFDLNHGYVSLDALDNSKNAVLVADAGVKLAKRQYLLDRVLLDKYLVLAPADGVLMAVNAGVGSYVSPQGVYDTYTGVNDPIAVMGTPQNSLAVRVYLDEILVARLPPPDKITAQMSVRGADLRLPLKFVRLQPYVTPKIDLSNARMERVDVRVLPLVFRFDGDTPFPIYPGQLVDVYIKEQ